MKKKISVDESLRDNKLPSTVKARINQLYKAVNSRVKSSYTDESWGALRDYNEAVKSVGGELTYWCENGGYCDRAEDGFPRSKRYEMEIEYPDGVLLSGYIKMMAAGTTEDPFSRYDTCMIVWKKGNVDESAIRKAINEELSKKDVKSMIDKAVEDALASSEFKRKVTNIAADVAENFIDGMFARKAFWKDAIRRN